MDRLQSNLYSCQIQVVFSARVTLPIIPPTFIGRTLKRRSKEKYSNLKTSTSSIRATLDGRETCVANCLDVISKSD